MIPAHPTIETAGEDGIDEVVLAALPRRLNVLVNIMGKVRRRLQRVRRQRS